MEAIEIKGKVNEEGKLIIEDLLAIRNKQVRVMLLIENEEEDERDAWIQASIARLSQAYEEDEPEYTLDMIKEPNPKYKGREKG